MPAPIITSFVDPIFDSKKSLLEKEIEEIFFESSTKKKFKDSAEKKQFHWKYLGFYLTHYPEYCWVAWEERVLGYLLGMPASHVPELYKIQPHMAIFQNFFQDYPAHLHINCHALARGQGIGSQLVKKFEKQLQDLNITGVHIMTGPSSPNRHFYQRLGFDQEVTLQFQGHPILFMGKRL